MSKSTPIQTKTLGQLAWAARRKWWCVLGGLLIVLGGLCNPTKAQTNERPNILFIFLDDYGWRDCGFMGSDFYETPHLDALAASGRVFTNAYSAAANCAPARACLLSGQYTPRHEIYNVGTGLRGNPKYSRLKHVPGTDTLDPSLQTWAHRLQEAGYRTGTIGKWHLSQDPLPYGFDFNFAGTHSGSPPRGYFPPHPKAPGLENAPKGEYLTDRLNKEALNFIDRNRDQPWALYLTHFAVHTPIQARKDIEAKYKAKQPGELHSNTTMAAMIQSVDDGVGKIVAKLEELGLRDKTMILFTSDNGGYGPATRMAPLKGYKGTYYEGGIREPFFVNWPGQVEVGQDDTPIINVDVYPTLCDVAGAPLPTGQELDGRSLVPLWQGGERSAFADRALFWHFPAYLQGYSRIDQQRDPIFRTRPCSIIRLGDWKLHEYFEDGALELYNLRDDIGETQNLVAQQPEKAEELHARLIAWRKHLSAPVPAEQNPRYDAEAEAKEIEKLLQKKKRKQ